MLSIGAVVHGVGLFLANDNAVFYQTGVLYQAQADDFCGGQLNQLSLVHGPQAIALIAEVLHSQAGLTEIGHHGGAPVLKVLDATHLKLRAVDVEPVVGEEMLDINHQGYN